MIRYFADDAMGDDDEEEESDAIVNQVLDELGLQLTDQLTAVPVAGGSIAAPGAKGKVPVAAAAEVRKFLSMIAIAVFLGEEPSQEITIPSLSVSVKKKHFLQ